MTAERFTGGVQVKPKLFQQQGVVLLIFRTNPVSGIGVSGVLPVDVDAVQIVLSDEGDGAFRKSFSTLGRERKIGEAGGASATAADRDQHLQTWVLSLQAVESGEVCRILRAAFDHHAVPDAEKRRS